MIRPSPARAIEIAAAWLLAVLWLMPASAPSWERFTSWPERPAPRRSQVRRAGRRWWPRYAVPGVLAAVIPEIEFIVGAQPVFLDAIAQGLPGAAEQARGSGGANWALRQDSGAGREIIIKDEKQEDKDKKEKKNKKG